MTRPRKVRQLCPTCGKRIGHYSHLHLVAKLTFFGLAYVLLKVFVLVITPYLLIVYVF